MNNDLFKSYQLSDLMSMTQEEFEAISGGYSWEEFKADCAAAWADFQKGFSSGYAAGNAAAKQ